MGWGEGCEIWPPYVTLHACWPRRESRSEINKKKNAPLEPFLDPMKIYENLCMAAPLPQLLHTQRRGLSPHVVGAAVFSLSQNYPSGTDSSSLWTSEASEPQLTSADAPLRRIYRRNAFLPVLAGQAVTSTPYYPLSDW